MWRFVLVLAVGLAAMVVAPGSKVACAQTFTGTAGLITVPTAEMNADGTVVIGAGFLDREAVSYQRGTNDLTPYYASITFLPFLELGFRFSPSVQSQRDALGDRMLLIRAQVLRERGPWPALALGMHDFFRSTDNQTNRYNALYLVASKSLRPLAGWPVSLHLGYGTDAMDAKGHQFVGLFGGAQWRAVDLENTFAVDLLAEYDGVIAAVGARLHYRWFYLLGAVQDFSALSGGGGLRVQL